ncbi:hypothetical protein [Moorena producens]|uniref:hypothetical protein n=1 Tax=Moorena producens TaxID=1155739 RepID=UPI003C74F256
MRSRMTGNCHVRFWRRVRCGATPWLSLIVGGNRQSDAGNRAQSVDQKQVATLARGDDKV